MKLALHKALIYGNDDDPFQKMVHFCFCLTVVSNQSGIHTKCFSWHSLVNVMFHCTCKIFLRKKNFSAININN